MDFQSLSRRELQALCKKNKIPANITNVAMAEALSALEKVEGLDQLTNAAKSDPRQSPVKDVPPSPANPQTACRTSTRMKVKIVEPESSKVGTRTRRATIKTDAVESKEEKENGETPAAPITRRRATAAAACRKLEIQVAETDPLEKPTGEDQENPPETLAVQSRRRRAPTASALKKQEAQKEIGSVQRAYSTRKSVRLLEKCMDNLSLTETEEVEKNANAEVLNIESRNADEKEENEEVEITSTEVLNNGNQNRDVEDKEENVAGVDFAKASEELVLNNAVELLEVNQESEINVIREAVLGKSNSLNDSSEMNAEGEDEIVNSGLSSVVTAGRSEMAVEDACGSVEVCEIKDEVQVDNQNGDSTDDEEQDVSVTESYGTSKAAPESEMEKPLNAIKSSLGEVESVEVSTDLMDDITGEQISKRDDISSSLNIEEVMAENGGEMEELLNGKEDSVESVEVSTDVTFNVEEFLAESEQLEGMEELLIEKEDSFVEVESAEVPSDLMDDSTAAAQISKPDDISSSMNVEEFMAEIEQDGSDDPDTKLELNRELDSSQPGEHQQVETFTDAAEESKPVDAKPNLELGTQKDIPAIESSATTELSNCSPTLKTEMDLGNLSADYDIEALINIDIIETKEVNTTPNVADASPQSENNAGCPQVPNTEVTGEIASETLINVQISQAVDYGNSSCIPQIQSSSTPTKSVLSDTKKVFSPFVADTIQGQFPRPTTVFTPTKPSAGKQQLLHSIDIINKENIDNSGTNLEGAKKGGDKNKKNFKDMSMRKLTKMLKEKLQIKNKSVDEANTVSIKVGEKVEKRRPALQTLTENCMQASTEPENKNY